MQLPTHRRAPRHALVIATSMLIHGCSSPAPLVTTSAPAPAASRGYTPTAPLPGAITVAFTLARADGPVPFLSTPWPSELARRPDGRLDLRSFPGADTSAFRPYVELATEDLDGYSVSPTIYFRFTGAIEAWRLPTDPALFASSSSPVALVDVDPQSPERGRLRPLAHRYYPADLRFVAKDTLAVKPVAGDILRPGTLYAAVVRRELAAGGLGTTMDLEAIKWTSPRTDPREEAARRLHEAAFDELAALGVPREAVAGIALFRTQTPHASAARMIEAIKRLPPSHAPRIVEAHWTDKLRGLGPDAPYLTIEGIYCTPNFQSSIERAPFMAEDGGRILTDAAGLPAIADVPTSGPYGSAECRGSLRARFVLTVPDRPMPPGGFPLLVAAHGTGGDAESFLGARSFAGWAAREGIAAISTDQPLHGGRGPAPRPGSREPMTISIAGIPVTLDGGAHAAEEAFYNPLHPAAARDNLRQAAADAMVLVRLLTATDFGSARGDDDKPLLGPSGTHAPPRFDRRRVLLAGHSQGAHSVAVAGAVDPLVRGVILSGCGGDLRIGVLGRRDLPVLPFFRAMLGLGADELDVMHPLMALVQTLADPVDPASYARLYWEPLEGRRAPDVLHFEGLGDSFSPPATAEILALALHATPVLPLTKPIARLRERETTLAELLERPGPVRAFAQLAPTRGEDGHFVMFREPEGRSLAMELMRATVR